jgi:hypothetical protein
MESTHGQGQQSSQEGSQEAEAGQEQEEIIPGFFQTLPGFECRWIRIDSSHFGGEGGECSAILAFEEKPPTP